MNYGVFYQITKMYFAPLEFLYECVSLFNKPKPKFWKLITQTPPHTHTVNLHMPLSKRSIFEVNFKVYFKYFKLFWNNLSRSKVVTCQKQTKQLQFSCNKCSFNVSVDSGLNLTHSIWLTLSHSCHCGKNI